MIVCSMTSARRYLTGRVRLGPRTGPGLGGELLKMLLLTGQSKSWNTKFKLKLKVGLGEDEHELKVMPASGSG